MALFSAIQPEKQNVDDAISKLCDRLEHAILLQDRRAAVLSLKGFSREYKEAVVAGGLRGLLKSLSLDKEDTETLKATLECILILFSQEQPGKVDDTALWIADEFTLARTAINLPSRKLICRKQEILTHFWTLLVMATFIPDCIRCKYCLAS